MYKSSYRDSPFGPQNWTDMYMARNYLRYMDSGKRPGCGWVIFFFAVLFILFLAAFYRPNRYASHNSSYTTGRIKSHSGLNIRSEANSKATVLGVVPYNEIVSIIDTNGHYEIISGQAANWIKIEYNGTTGWVWGGLVEQ